VRNSSSRNKPNSPCSSTTQRRRHETRLRLRSRRRRIPERVLERNGQRSEIRNPRSCTRNGRKDLVRCRPPSIGQSGRIGRCAGHTAVIAKFLQKVTLSSFRSSCLIHILILAQKFEIPLTTHPYIRLMKQRYSDTTAERRPKSVESDTSKQRSESFPRPNSTYGWHQQTASSPKTSTPNCPYTGTISKLIEMNSTCSLDSGINMCFNEVDERQRAKQRAPAER
jgi:hypothetical protein